MARRQGVDDQGRLAIAKAAQEQRAIVHAAARAALWLAAGGPGGQGARWALQAGHFAISAEGLSIVFNVNKDLFIKALVVALGIGLISGIYPAVLSVKGRLSDKLRSA